MTRGAGALLSVPLLAAALSAAEPWTAPPEAKARVNPVEPSESALLKGRALYQKHCASCHGDKGKGDGPAEHFTDEPATDLTDAAVQARWTDGEMFWKISTGRREGADVIMPALANKVPSDEDRWKVVLFVRQLRTAASPVP